MSYGKRYSFIKHKVKSVTTTNNFTTEDNSLAVECDGDTNKLQRLLELLNTTNDVDFNSKILSALSAYLMFNNRFNIDKIVKCNALYEKICNVISKASPRKATDALNFLSALLYVDADEETSTRKAMALYARNMTRVSGCLAAMSEMFCSNTMYLDTWKALCQCLAVACGECEVNQSYCTHLVPMCTPKCSQENIDVFLVLQALLFNHNRNIKLFLESKGLSVFTRELLHYDKCLQLLTTVTQCQAVSPLVFRDTSILTHLQDFIQQYGPRSQIGQKAMIILHHIQSRTKGITRKLSIGTKTNTTIRNTQNVISNSKLVNRMANITKTSKNISDIDTQNTFDETKTLMQNVMKEVFQWKQDEVAKVKKAITKRNNIGKLHSDKRKFVRNISNKTFMPINDKPKNDIYGNKSTELSFSFLNNIQDSKTKNNTNQESNGELPQLKKLHYKNDYKYSDRKDTETNYKDSTEATDLNDFVPAFMSTPKHSQESNDAEQTNKNKTLLHQNTKTKYDTRKILNNSKLQRRKLKITQQEKNKDDKDINNRTLSSRFFSAINDSCTTLMKSVKNMFTKKENLEATKNSLTLNSTADQSKENKPFSQFSFTNYMKKREAGLKSNKFKKKMNTSNFSIESGSCKTCDDTQELRKKMLKDENLKQTIKKLKLGINLYGCDFKKISKTMWPRESYMTPTILYNLYRKLILK